MTVVRKTPAPQTKEHQISVYTERLNNCERSIGAWEKRQSQDQVDALIKQQEDIIAQAQAKIAEVKELQLQAPIELTTLQARKRFLEKKLAELKYANKIERLMKLTKELNEMTKDSPEAQALMQRILEGDYDE